MVIRGCDRGEKIKLLVSGLSLEFVKNKSNKMQLKISSEIYTFPVPATASFLALFCLRELRPFPDTFVFFLSHRFLVLATDLSYSQIFLKSLDDFLRCDGLQ